jgi:acetyltransferase-like isoleucine patch superfamily enzyme
MIDCKEKEPIGVFALYDEDYIAKAVKGKYSYHTETTLSFIDIVKVKFLKLNMYIAYIVVSFISHLPIFSSLLESFARIYSQDPIGYFLRGAYYKNKLRRMGKNVLIDRGVNIWYPQNVEIDDYTHIDKDVKIEGSKDGFVKIGKYNHIANNVVLQGGGGLSIGDYVGIASGTLVYSASNFYKDPNRNSKELLSMSIAAPPDKQYVIKKPVTIEDYAFLGLNVVVTPGIKIGKGAVVGAGAIVTKDIPIYSIAVGNPARVIKKRPHDEGNSSDTH